MTLEFSVGCGYKEDLGGFKVGCPSLKNGGVVIDSVFMDDIVCWRSQVER